MIPILSAFSQVVGARNVHARITEMVWTKFKLVVPTSHGKLNMPDAWNCDVGLGYKLNDVPDHDVVYNRLKAAIKATATYWLEQAIC